jgi:hypothetical protein
MKLAEWLAGVPEGAAKAGPGRVLADGEPGSRAQPLRYTDLLDQRRQQLDPKLG